MNRRQLLKGIAALGAGLILPPTLAENTETVRRYWALGAIPAPIPEWNFEWNCVMRGPEHLGLCGWQAAAWRERLDLPLATWEGHSFPRRDQVWTPIVRRYELPGGVDPRDIVARLLAQEIAWAEGRG